MTILALLYSKLTSFFAIGAGIVGLFLYRKNTKLKQEIENANFISGQAQASKDQIEEMVAKAEKVIAKQKQIQSDTPTDRESIHEWLRELSRRGSARSSSNEADKQSLQDDNARVSVSEPKNNRGA